MKTVTKKFLSDDNHGWLSVKKKELFDLGISQEISGWSYMKGQSVYLEEDADADIYIKAQRSIGVTVLIIRGKQYKTSPIRKYSGYSV